LDSIGVDLRYPKRSVIVREGERAPGVMLLRSGSAKLKMSLGDRSVILGIVKLGQALGLHSVLRDEPSTTSAESLESCEVVFYPRNDFLKFMEEHVEAWFVVAQQLADSYEAACGALRQICSARSAPEKLAAFLLQWAAQSRDGRGVNATQKLTRVEIGQMIGVSRETVIRMLGEFKDRGLATVEGTTVLIPDGLALIKFASGSEV
jgi:CRP-like cAMP-binding protein